MRAVPSTNATVARSPAQMLLTFSEPVDASLSHVRLVDALGRRERGVASAQAVPGATDQLRIALTAPLARGVYSVDWQTVSALDGHYAAGAYVFGVGVADVGAVAPFGKFASTSPWLSAVAVRAGPHSTRGSFSCWARRRLPDRAGRPPAGRRPRPAAGRLAAGRARGGHRQLSERAMVRAPTLLPLFETHEGLTLLGQCLAVIFVCGVAVLAAGLIERPIALVGVGGAAALTALVVIWGSHADAPSAWRLLNLVDQWLHIVAVGVWIGGLPWLLLGLRGLAGPARQAVVRRFAALATVALVVVLLTGVARAVSEVGSSANLLTTSFGVALLVKIGLVCALVALERSTTSATCPPWFATATPCAAAPHRARRDRAGRGRARRDRPARRPRAGRGRRLGGAGGAPSRVVLAAPTPRQRCACGSS